MSIVTIQLSKSFTWLMLTKLHFNLLTTPLIFSFTKSCVGKQTSIHETILDSRLTNLVKLERLYQQMYWKFGSTLQNDSVKVQLFHKQYSNTKDDNIQKSLLGGGVMPHKMKDFERRQSPFGSIECPSLTLSLVETRVLGSSLLAFPTRVMINTYNAHHNASCLLISLSKQRSQP